MNRLVIVLIFFMQGIPEGFAQCTPEKDADMAKYQRLTKTLDAQGCSQCGMLALYFCSAKHCVKQADIDEVGKRIRVTKQIIQNMGQPYCCSELLNKEPEWGIAIRSGGAVTAAAGSPGDVAQSANTVNGSKPSGDLVTKYRNLAKQNPSNALNYNFCASAAQAQQTMPPAAFATFAKTAVAAMKKRSPNMTNPCDDVLGAFWDSKLAAVASGGDLIRPDERAPIFTADKSPVRREVNVEVDQIPDFAAGASLMIPGEVKGSYRGLYVVFNAGSGETRVYKKHGRDWSKSKQDAAILSVWITSHPDNEVADAMNYHWTGSPLKAGSSPVNPAPNLGSYNVSGNSFAIDNPPSKFLAITGDKARYSLWGFGDARPVNVNAIGNAHLYRVNDQYGRPEGQGFDEMDVSKLLDLGGDVIMEGAVSKADNHIWIAQGKKLYKAMPQGNPGPFTFKTLMFKDDVIKLRVRDDFTWVLAGGSIYKIGRDNIPRKFYDGPVSSFAVDQNHVYTSDGFILQYSNTFKKKLLGDGPDAFSKKQWTQLNAELSGLELEVAEGEGRLYLVNTDSGKVYTILTR